MRGRGGAGFDVSASAREAFRSEAPAPTTLTLTLSRARERGAGTLRIRLQRPAHQKLTGLSMIDLCLPSVPWATIEPKASTMTRVPNSAVMSEVS